MRNSSKAATLESKFPLLAIENDCIISKDADVTVCFKVRLPELFTVASAEYEAMHSAWFKAIKHYLISLSFTSRTGLLKKIILLIFRRPEFSLKII